MEIGIKSIFFSKAYLQSMYKAFSCPCVDVRPAKFTIHTSGDISYREKKSRQPDVSCGSWSLFILSFLFFSLESLHMLYLLPRKFSLSHPLTQLVKYFSSVFHIKINFLREGFLDSKGHVRPPQRGPCILP